MYASRADDVLVTTVLHQTGNHILSFDVCIDHSGSLISGNVVCQRLVPISRSPNVKSDKTFAMDTIHIIIHVEVRYSRNLVALDSSKLVESMILQLNLEYPSSGSRQKPRIPLCGIMKPAYSPTLAERMYYVRVSTARRRTGSGGRVNFINIYEGK